jgi:hypothetical protein
MTIDDDMQQQRGRCKEIIINTIASLVHAKLPTASKGISSRINRFELTSRHVLQLKAFCRMSFARDRIIA